MEFSCCERARLAAGRLEHLTATSLMFLHYHRKRCCHRELQRRTRMWAWSAMKLPGAGLKGGLIRFMGACAHGRDPSSRGTGSTGRSWGYPLLDGALLMLFWTANVPLAHETRASGTLRQAQGRLLAVRKIMSVTWRGGWSACRGALPADDPPGATKTTSIDASLSVAHAFVSSGLGRLAEVCGDADCSGR